MPATIGSGHRPVNKADEILAVLEFIFYWWKAQ